jgi:hypothetical protein
VTMTQPSAGLTELQSAVEEAIARYVSSNPASARRHREAIRARTPDTIGGSSRHRCTPQHRHHRAPRAQNKSGPARSHLAVCTRIRGKHAIPRNPAATPGERRQVVARTEASRCAHPVSHSHLASPSAAQRCRLARQRAVYALLRHCSARRVNPAIAGLVDAAGSQATSRTCASAA